MTIRYLHTMVRVLDLEASMAFYEKLGLKETRRIDNEGGRFTLGPFDIEFVPVAHSIPESNALAIRSPAGLVVHTCDW